MNLFIEARKSPSTRAFVDWVLTDIKEAAVGLELRDGELETTWDKYFQETDLGWATDETGSPVPPTVNFIINQYFDNLVVLEESNGYNIITDSAIKLYGTDLTVDSVASLINYGTLSTPPYPYFDLIFELYAEGLPDIYETWAQEYAEEDTAEGSDL